MNTWTYNLRAMLGLSEKAETWMPTIAALFALAFLARMAVLVFFLIGDPSFIIDNDSAGYLSLAKHLLAGQGFSWDTGMPFTPDSFRTPGYPFFLAVHYVFFGSFIPALVTQIFLSLLIGFLIVRLADRYLSIKTGIVSAGLFFFMPFSLLVTERYLTQICFTAIFMAGVWFWLEFLRSGKKTDLLLVAILIPLSALVRPIAIFLLAPFIASLCISWLLNNTSLKKALTAGVVLVLIFGAILAPWVWRNYRIFGIPALSSITAVQLYFYDAPAIYATAKHIPYEAARTALNKHIAQVTGYSVAENPILYTELSPLTPTLKEEGRKFALADPYAFVKTRAIQFFAFFTRDGIRYWIEHYGVDTYHGAGLIPIIIERIVLFFLTLGFFWYAFKTTMRKNIYGITLALVALYFALLSGVMSSAGLRFPAEPLFLLFGVAGLAEIVLFFKNRMHSI